MSLKHVIIGLLLEHPMHGYALKRAISPALSGEDLVNDGILYPILDRLQRDGLVQKRVVAGQGRPNRSVISATERGERWFHEWLLASDADEVTYNFLIGQPFLAKCMFLSRLSPRAIKRKIEGQRQQATAKRETFSAIRSGMLERDVDHYRVAILDLGISQQTLKIEWLDRLLSEKIRRPVRKQRGQK